MLALVIVVATAIAGGGLLLSADEEGSESALSPTQTVGTSTPIPLPTPWVLPGQPPPMPTPDPVRNVPEVTLVDTQNGGTIPLWEPGYRIHEVVFQSDWLYYVRFPVATGVVDAEIMAFSLQSHQSAYKLADGYNITISVYGDIAYTVRHPDGTDTGATLDRFWRPGPPPGGAGRFAWSPDGRWLTSGDGYLGDGVPIPQYILDYDFRTARVRQFAETFPCHCDGGPRVLWAPDGARFQFTRITGVPGQGDYISEIYEPWNLTRVAAPQVYTWIDATSYIVMHQPPPEANYIYIVATGQKTALPAPVLPSPYGPLLATLPGFDEVTFSVLAEDGSTIVAGLAGAPVEFSQDGKHILSLGDGGCGHGLNVYRIVDGGLVLCKGGAGGSISPDGTRVAAVATRYVMHPPVGSATPQTSELWVIDLMTGSERQVASDLRGGLGCAYWSPDSRYVVVAFCPGV